MFCGIIRTIMFIEICHGVDFMDSVILNDVIKVVIADDNALVREILTDALSEEKDIKIVATATNGRETIEYINQYKPDVVLLDLIMPIVDGMGVMEEIREHNGDSDKPYFVIISAAGKENIISQALETGASYFFMKPFDEASLIKRIRQLCRQGHQPEPVQPYGSDKPATLENRVAEVMRRLNVSIKMVGSKYLREAIMIAIEEPEALLSVTKNIYPIVAEHHGTSSGNVERNIRYVIESTWSRIVESGNEEEVRGILGDISKKPTNSEFILACSEWIKYH